jgi:hypothetical protein
MIALRRCPHRLTGLAYLFAGTIWLLSARFCLAGPRDDLLRRLPDGMGFCLVIQDLRGTAPAFMNSPFVEHFSHSVVGRAIVDAPELQKLRKAEQFLQQKLQVDWARFRDDIVGDAVVFAYRPGTGAHPEEEQGLLLLEARDGDLLAKLVSRLIDAQKTSGELKDLQVRKHQGVEYNCRVTTKDTTFHYVNGRFLAFTNREQLLCKVIDRDRGPPTKDDPAVSKHLRQLGADGDLAALWVDPRVFDAEIEKAAAEAPPPEAAVRRCVLTYWKSLSGIVVSLALHRQDVELRMGFLARKQELPSPARELFVRDSQPSELWQRFPEKSLLVVAGRFDAGGFPNFLNNFLTADSREALDRAVQRGPGAALGKDVFHEVLPLLGPDWGMCISPAPSDRKEWFPYCIWALRVRPGDQKPTMDRVLLNGIQAIATLLVFGYNGNNKDQLRLGTVFQDKVEVKFLANDKLFPPGLQPAFAYKDGYLLIASSPEAIAAFRPAAGPPAKTTADEVPVLRASFTEAANFLTDRQEALVSHVAEKDNVSKEEAAHRLGCLREVVRLFDSLELMQRFGPDQFTLVLRLKAKEPLRK